jgi:hypothetical protein
MISRRGFFKLAGKVAGALAIEPAVAKLETQIESVTPSPVTPSPAIGPFDGQIRLNTTENILEVYYAPKWIIYDSIKNL